MNKEEKKLIEEAMTWLGTPYKYGGADKGICADCSGFVMRVYESALDYKLPRNSKKQSEFCKKIKKEHIRPGDLVFFATGKEPGVVSHVGIMIDEIQFIHASSSKGVVVSKMTQSYYQKHFVMYGKVPK